MKGKKLICFFILLSWLSFDLSAGIFVAFADLVSLTKFYNGLSNDISNFINGIDTSGKTDAVEMESLFHELNGRDKTHQLTIIATRMMDKLNELDSLFQNLEYSLKKSALINDFSMEVDEITQAFNTLQRFADNPKEITERRIENFIKHSIKSSGKNSIEGSLRKIQSIVSSPNNPENLLNVMSAMERMKHQKSPCGSSIPHSILFEFYKTITGVELLGYTTLIYGYTMDKINDPDLDVEKEINFLLESSQRRMTRYTMEFAAVIKKLNRKFYSCDPMEYQSRDVTFTEMWGIKQLMLFSEYNLVGQCSTFCKNTYRSSGPDDWCYRDGPKTWTAFKDGIPEDPNKCLSSRACRGTVSDCWHVSGIEACISRNSTRRYEWSHTSREYSNTNKWYGKWTDCENGVHWKFRDQQYDGFWGCHFCYCTCFDNAPTSISVHTVSLKPARSNTAKNRVIVGVRFRVVDNILYIQVRDAPIEAGYTLNSRKTFWVRLPKMNDEIIKSRQNSNDATLSEGVDFTTMTKDHAFNFDFLKVPHGRVLTGVKFELVQIEGSYPKRLELHIESMEYDYKTGELKKDSAEWTKPEDTKGHTQRNIPDLHSPEKSTTPTKVDSNNKQFIALEMSDLISDVSQTVVPLFDAQTMQAAPSSPLAGLGLHHRGNDDSAGFIAFYGDIINYGQYIHDSYQEYYEDELARQNKVNEIRNGGSSNQNNDEYDEYGDNSDD